MKNGEESQPLSAGKIIGELSRGAHIYFQHAFKDYAIGHAQIRTLLYISRHEGLTQMEIAKTLNLDKSSITSQLQLLERNGYISRHTSKKDARMQVIYLTDKARGILEPLKQVLLSWTETLLDGFTEKERTETFLYLERMRDNARESIRNITKKKSMD